MNENSEPLPADDEPAAEEPSGAPPADAGPFGAISLRPQTGEALRTQPARSNGPLSHEEALALVHELQVHRIEMELQHEELMRIRREDEGLRNRYADLYDFAPIGYFTLDEVGVIREANLAGAVQLGVDRESLIGAEFATFLPPDSRPGFAAFCANVLASGTTETFEVPFAAGAEREAWYAQLQGRADAAGAAVFIRLVVTDITDRRRVEDALVESEADARSLFANMVDACAVCELVVDERGEPVDIRLVDVNPAFAHALSVPAELIVGQTAFMILPTLHRGWLDLFLEVSRQRTFIQVEDAYPALDRWYHLTAYPVRGGRVAVVFRDITERREAEAERARFTEELRRSNEELQRFAYVASHDLQEPLRSIVSFGQLLERRCRGQLGPDADEYIAFIVEGGVRMQRLIADLLQLSRIDTAAKPPVPIDAGAVVNAALRALDAPIREAGATVTIGPMPTVMADPTQLEQVFSNLITNALKYHREGVPPEVRIGAEQRDGWWEISVADNGIGIEAEFFDRIFEMFQRLHATDEYGGTGIGLAVVKKIVERHGGTVRVESTRGEGSTFFFTLPAA